MFDILLTTYEFISGVGYFIYSVADAFDTFVDFITRALPFSLKFLNFFKDVPVLVAIASISIGSRLVRFIRGVS